MSTGWTITGKAAEGEIVQAPPGPVHCGAGIGRAAFGRLLAGTRERPEVVVCSSDWLALGCLGLAGVV